MKAMILTAGLGTRLRPLTLERAKPAVPLFGRPLAARLIEGLVRSGVDRFRLNLHHLPETIISAFESADSTLGTVSFSHEPEILGTAGGLKRNQDFFDEDMFLMANGDIVAQFPLAKAIAFHRERNAFATMILYPQTPPFQYYPVRIDSDNRLHDFKGCNQDGTATSHTYVFTGVHILSPEIFDFIPADEFYEINSQAYPAALRAGKEIYGFPVSHYWNDIGDPARYLNAHRDLASMGLTIENAHISSSASVAQSASVSPGSSVGPGCVLEARTVVQGSVLWDDIRVTQGVQVERCIIGSGVTVNADCTNSVITRHGERSIE